MDGYISEENNRFRPSVRFQTNLNRTTKDIASLVARPLVFFIPGRYYISGPYNREANHAEIYEESIFTQGRAVLEVVSKIDYESKVIEHVISTGQSNPKDISLKDLRELLRRSFRHKRLFPKNHPKIRTY